MSSPIQELAALLGDQGGLFGTVVALRGDMVDVRTPRGVVTVLASPGIEPGARVRIVDQVAWPAIPPGKAYALGGASSRAPPIVQPQPSWGTFTCEAGQDLGAGRAVILDTDETVRYADSGTSDHAGRVAGITVHAVQAGGRAVVQQTGVRRDPAWSWTPGNPIHVGTVGVLTQSVPTTGHVTPVGLAQTSIKILVAIGPSVILAA